ncbi:MAG: argininosuccinate synthase [Acidobacteria bacterium]|nr:argininosuccinate synthase [Acidobacteriota bacterium]MCW5967636.1 argininosuccinate synthase [Blastocatellales bacterium]
MSKQAKRVALAYSGGLDTSIIIPWLKENYDCEVVAIAADVGQGEELDGLREKAVATGAAEIYIEDLRHEFVTEYIYPTLRAGAVYEHKYLLGTSFARPVIAKKQVEIAKQTGCDALCHGCTGKGNDQVRFELTFKALAPEMEVIAPWREWSIVSREDAIDYANERQIPITASREKIYSRDRNIWHISHEGGILEDPASEPEEAMYMLTASPEAAPDTPEYVEIAFESGTPVAVNGEHLDPVPLLERLNEIGSRNAIGRIDLVENRLVGIKSRGCYETPGGTLLLAALRELEALCLDRETAHYKEQIALKYAEMVYFGQWFTPLREALDAFVNSVIAPVSGSVRLKLYKGNVIIAGRTSPQTLYRPDLASFTMGASYDQRDAAGFINIFGLPLKVQALTRG